MLLDIILSRRKRFVNPLLCYPALFVPRTAEVFVFPPASQVEKIPLCNACGQAGLSVFRPLCGRKSLLCHACGQARFSVSRPLRGRKSLLCHACGQARFSVSRPLRGREKFFHAILAARDGVYYNEMDHAATPQTDTEQERARHVPAHDPRRRPQTV